MTSYEDIVCDANNLYKAYKASIKGSKWKETTHRFMVNFLTYIFQLQEELLSRTFTNGPVHEFTLSERGKIRPIASFPVKDRIVRHVLIDDVLLPEVRKKIIYDNCASIEGRGISQQRKRFEIHLHRYYKAHGNDGWILLGDFSKFYDNIIHEIAKRQLMELFGDDEFVSWLLSLIFDGFRVDVSYMSDEEYERCYDEIFDSLAYRDIPKDLLTGEKWMNKSVIIGDHLSQVIGVFYPNCIDTWIKYVCGQKFYGRYVDDWYVMNPDRQALINILHGIEEIALGLGIHINYKKTRIIKISSTFRFLQIKYSLTSDGRVIKRINPKRISNERRRLRKYAAKVAEGVIPYETVEGHFKSWMGSFYKLMSREQRKNLISLFEGLFNKKISIMNKKMVMEDADTGLLTAA
mgnify:CR=1 FL=1